MGRGPALDDIGYSGTFGYWGTPEGYFDTFDRAKGVAESVYYEHIAEASKHENEDSSVSSRQPSCRAKTSHQITYYPWHASPRSVDPARAHPADQAPGRIIAVA